MNRLSANIPNADSSSVISGERTASERKSSVRTETSNVAHLRLQVWKGYLLLTIIFGMFILVPLNVTGGLKPLLTNVLSKKICN